MLVKANRKNMMAEANNYSQPFKNIILRFMDVCQIINLKIDRFKIETFGIDEINLQKIRFNLTVISSFYRGWPFKNDESSLYAYYSINNKFMFDFKDSYNFAWYMNIDLFYHNETIEKIEFSDFFGQDFPKESEDIIKKYFIK